MKLPRFRCPLVVGRQEEQAILRDFRRRAETGSGSIVLVGGDAGIGKSRLVDACFSTSGDIEVMRAVAPCFETARSPLAPILDWLRLLANTGSASHEMAPSIARLLDLEAQDATRGAPATRRDHFFAIVSYLRTYAEEIPLLLWIEDVHWADAETLEFLRFLAGHAAELAALVIATFRPSEFASPAFSGWYTSITRSPSVHTLLLKPLADDAMMHFIDETLRGQAALSARVRRDVRVRSGGNPLFAEELLEHASAGSSEPLPVTLQAILLQKLHAFGPAQRTLFELAAAFPTTFNTADLAAVAGRRLADVDAALRVAQHSGLISEVRGRAGTWTFHHNLIRDGLYRAVETSSATRAHRRIAERIERQSPESRDVLALGYHWSQAGDHVKAAECF